MTLLGGEGNGAVDNSGAGDGGSGGNAGAAGGGNGGAGAGNGSGAGGGTPTWRDSLPEDIRANATLSKFSDVNGLAKSYIEIQSLVGKKGVFPPGEKATPEQWQSFFKSIGQPELEKFEIKAPEGKQLSPDLGEGFKKAAHESGLLPQQAQKLLDWYLGQEEGSSKAKAEAAKAKSAAMQEGLKKEWGDGYDKQLALARLAVKDVGGEDFGKYLASSGLGNDAQVVKLMAKVGALLGEDKIRGEGSGGKFGQTPDEIRAQIGKVQGDLKHPYYDKSHAGHKQAVSEMEQLYKKLYGQA